MNREMERTWLRCGRPLTSMSVSSRSSCVLLSVTGAELGKEVLIDLSRKCVVWFQSLEAVRPALYSRGLFRNFQTACLMRRGADEENCMSDQSRPGQRVSSTDADRHVRATPSIISRQQQ
jgi:hypothetical protein